MISVKEAIEILKANCNKTEIVEVSLPKSLNLFLAEAIYAPINVPSFNQSAMDGYAFKFEDLESEFAIVEEIPAGDIRTVDIKEGEAVRIFTGAKVPDSCDTVVMQELTGVIGDKLVVKDVGLKLGGNIRKEGHQIRQGDLALEKGAKINPAAIGFLASLGITKVQVYQKPRVTILATGNELVKPGNPLQKGQVYESNTIMLQSALNNIGIQPEVVFLLDDLEQTKSAIKKALISSDILILSGGISVGDYDFVKPALEANGVEELFYKVKQKPGKPLFFGSKEDSLVFALPGNPAAALNCFYMYVLPAINIQLGNPKPLLPKTELPINQSYKKKSGRAEFLKACTNGINVDLLEGQGSDVLLSFAKANCLVFLSDEIVTLEQNDIVEVFLLPS
ncbi:MAG: molybdopterin molybdotransferase MoeA [Vicingaceae bacterium]|nr:molybdopterin molybdotransferase MoeA [Vicingaceae bacterium]